MINFSPGAVDDPFGASAGSSPVVPPIIPTITLVPRICVQCVAAMAIVYVHVCVNA